MREGLILNMSDSRGTRLEWRDHAPCFELDDGLPVFEAWFWHEELERWFCMSHWFRPELQSEGIVFFRPGDLQGLKLILTHLGRQAGLT